MPNYLSRDVTRAYKQSMKLFKLRNIKDYQNIIGGSKEKEGKEASTVTLSKK